MNEARNRRMKVAQPLRIAVVLGHWQNYGVETLVMNLYRHIDRNRIQFDFIVCETDDSDMPQNEIVELGGRVFIVPSYGNLRSYIKELRELFSEQDWKIAHCHMSTLNVFPLYAAMKARVPIRIAHVHTMAGKGEYIKNAAKYCLRLFSTCYATHYATSSMLAGRWIYRGKVEDSDMYYLPVARDITEFRFDLDVREKTRKQLGITDRFVIGHLGRFVPQKNHEFILKLFKEVHDSDPDAMLLLAGDGPLVGDVLSEADRLGISRDVLYIGRRSDASALYQAMDVFVLPSLYEGVPGTGIEAQAAGLPFIFADTITEEARVLETAVRLPLDDISAWKCAVLAAKESPRMDAFSELVEAGFEIKAAAKNLANYYESLIG